MVAGTDFIKCPISKLVDGVAVTFQAWSNTNPAFLALCLSDGKIQVYCEQDDTMQLVDSIITNASFTYLSWHPTLPVFLAGAADGSLRVWRETAGLVADIPCSANPPAPISTIAWEQQGFYSVCGDEQGRAMLYCYDIHRNRLREIRRVVRQSPIIHALFPPSTSTPLLSSPLYHNNAVIPPFLIATKAGTVFHITPEAQTDVFSLGTSLLTLQPSQDGQSFTLVGVEGTVAVVSVHGETGKGVELSRGRLAIVPPVVGQKPLVCWIGPLTLASAAPNAIKIWHLRSHLTVTIPFEEGTIAGLAWHEPSSSLIVASGNTITTLLHTPQLRTPPSPDDWRRTVHTKFPSMVTSSVSTSTSTSASTSTSTSSSTPSSSSPTTSLTSPLAVLPARVHAPVIAVSCADGPWLARVVTLLTSLTGETVVWQPSPKKIRLTTNAMISENTALVREGKPPLLPVTMSLPARPVAMSASDGMLVFTSGRTVYCYDIATALEQAAVGQKGIVEGSGEFSCATAAVCIANGTIYTAGQHGIDARNTAGVVKGTLQMDLQRHGAPTTLFAVQHTAKDVALSVGSNTAPSTPSIDWLVVCITDQARLYIWDVSRREARVLVSGRDVSIDASDTKDAPKQRIRSGAVAPKRRGAKSLLEEEAPQQSLSDQPAYVPAGERKCVVRAAAGNSDCSQLALSVSWLSSAERNCGVVVYDITSDLVVPQRTAGEVTAVAWDSQHPHLLAVSHVAVDGLHPVDEEEDDEEQERKPTTTATSVYFLSGDQLVLSATVPHAATGETYMLGIHTPVLITLTRNSETITTISSSTPSSDESPTPKPEDTLKDISPAMPHSIILPAYRSVPRLPEKCYPLLISLTHALTTGRADKAKRLLAHIRSNYSTPAEINTNTNSSGGVGAGASAGKTSSTHGSQGNELAGSIWNTVARFACTSGGEVGAICVAAMRSARTAWLVSGAMLGKQIDRGTLLSPPPGDAAAVNAHIHTHANDKVLQGGVYGKSIGLGTVDRSEKTLTSTSTSTSTSAAAPAPAITSSTAAGVKSLSPQALALMALSLDMPQAAKQALTAAGDEETLCTILSVAGKHDEAIALAQQCCRLMLPALYYRAGEYYLKMCRMEDAWSLFRRARCIAPIAQRVLLERGTPGAYIVCEKEADPTWMSEYCVGKEAVKEALELAMQNITKHNFKQTQAYTEVGGKPANAYTLGNPAASRAGGQMTSLLLRLRRISEAEAYAGSVESGLYSKLIYARWLESQGDVPNAIKWYGLAGSAREATRLALTVKGSNITAVGGSWTRSLCQQVGRELELRKRFKDAVLVYVKAAQLWSIPETQDVLVTNDTYIPDSSSESVFPGSESLIPPLARALHLCLTVPIPALLPTVLPLCPGVTLPADVLDNCVDMVKDSDPVQACTLLASNKRFKQAVALLQFDRLTQECVDACTPAKGDLPDEERKAVLLELAKVCEKGRQWVWACKRYTLAGDKARAVRCLCREGDVGKVWYYAKTARQREVIVLAARWMQQVYFTYVQEREKAQMSGGATDNPYSVAVPKTEEKKSAIGEDGCVDVNGKRQDVREMILELYVCARDAAGACDWCREATNIAARQREYKDVLRWTQEEEDQASKGGLDVEAARGRRENAQAMLTLMNKARKGDADVLEAGRALQKRCEENGVRVVDVIGVMVEYCAKLQKKEEGQSLIRELLHKGIDVWTVVSENAVVSLGMEEEVEKALANAGELDEEVGW